MSCPGTHSVAKKVYMNIFFTFSNELGAKWSVLEVELVLRLITKYMASQSRPSFIHMTPVATVLLGRA